MTPCYMDGIFYIYFFENAMTINLLYKIFYKVRC